ncbi:R3H domain-containing nucleic acid-binding protein [Desulfovibrio sp.]|uniref:Jag family protein n=1 Tax=Desulfovibrio sp. TaxID=885 RepID=UPI0023CA28A1|nr:R3H domain-containing nucleic acid-binding protein [Desulfovibrio sp.]MDE7240518.1 Jag N-terminal domain-containing protein [Desulfovibrio sp.]
MDGFKEFQGKDLDSAIAEACGYFDLPREKLEIEIVQDAKTGIFGIVGARKAKVRARRAQLREAVESVLGPRGGRRPTAAAREDEVGESDRKDRHEAQAGNGKRPPSRKARAERKAARAEAPAGEAETLEATAAIPEAPQTQDDAASTAPTDESAAEAAPAANGERARHASARPHAAPPHSQGAPARTVPDREAPERAPAQGRAPRDLPPAQDLDADDAPEGLPRTPVEELDPEKLQGLTEATVKELVRPITGGRVPVTVRVEDGRVRANVDWSGDAGLLIGREGQTLAALQYLASRMVSHGMNAAVRVQLDIGDYRLRQDEKLRAIALGLAEKARATGRPYSTRPLSSYHRRIIHLALQDAADLQTRSSGEGPLKRVIISRRKPDEA